MTVGLVLGIGLALAPSAWALGSVSPDVGGTVVDAAAPVTAQACGSTSSFDPSGGGIYTTTSTCSVGSVASIGCTTVDAEPTPHYGTWERECSATVTGVASVGCRRFDSVSDANPYATHNSDTTGCSVTALGTTVTPCSHTRALDYAAAVSVRDTESCQVGPVTASCSDLHYNPDYYGGVSQPDRTACTLTVGTSTTCTAGFTYEMVRFNTLPVPKGVDTPACTP